MMKAVAIALEERALRVTWADGSKSEYPLIWLRDNDPGELHPLTRERTFDLTSVALDIVPTGCRLERDCLLIDWPGGVETSVYPSDWLLRHRPGSIRPDPALVARQTWDAAGLGTIPAFDAGACVANPVQMRDALLALKQVGVVIFSGLEDALTAGEAFAARIGCKRETNFGVMFEVQSKPDPNNLAYTSMALPLHTDLPNQDVIPGFQFLHAYRNEATGGDSVFADGFRICEDLRREMPRNYELLKSVAIPWRFHDADNDIRSKRPIINEAAGGLDSFVFNAHIADVPDLDADLLYRFYAAYQDLMLRVRRSDYKVRYALQAGEMVAFDNKRVLHGRTAFDPDSGDRHFRGYYIEQNEIDSRIRVLSREEKDAPANES